MRSIRCTDLSLVPPVGTQVESIYKTPTGGVMGARSRRVTRMIVWLYNRPLTLGVSKANQQIAGLESCERQLVHCFMIHPVAFDAKSPPHSILIWSFMRALSVFSLLYTYMFAAGPNKHDDFHRVSDPAEILTQTRPRWLLVNQLKTTTPRAIISLPEPRWRGWGKPSTQDQQCV